MTLPSNPTLQGVNAELGRASTQAFNMDSDSDTRLLAKVAASGPWNMSSLAGRSAFPKTLAVGGSGNLSGYLELNFGSFSPNYTTYRGGSIDTFVSRDPTSSSGRTTLSVRGLSADFGQHGNFSRIRIRTGSFLGTIIRELFPGDATYVASFVGGSYISQWSWYAGTGVGDWMLPYRGSNLFFTMFEP